MNYKNFELVYRNVLITRVHKEYERTDSGKSWKKQPTEEHAHPVTVEFYNRFINSIPFFNNWGSCKASHTYTEVGYIPTEIISISPDKNTKMVDRFEFTEFPMYKALSAAGYREKEVLENYKTFTIEYVSGRKLFHFYCMDPETPCGQNDAAVYDATYNKWVG